MEDEIDDEIASGIRAEERPLGAERGVEQGVVFEGVGAEPSSSETVRLVD